MQTYNKAGKYSFLKMTTHKRLKKLWFYSLTLWGTLNQQMDEAFLDGQAKLWAWRLLKINTICDGERIIQDKMKNVYA